MSDSIDLPESWQIIESDDIQSTFWPPIFQPMKALVKFLVNFSGAAVSLYGAIAIGANGVTLLYLLNGTITPGDENRFLEATPETLHVAVTLLIGIALLAAGYKGPRYFAAYMDAVHKK